MNSPDSISDPVARTISYTGSYTSLAARLGSRLMTWLVGPTVLTCQMTGWWHGMPTVYADITITSGWRHPWHAYCACWRHNCIMLMSSLFGSITWVCPSGRRRRVRSVARVCACEQQPRRRVMARAALSDVRFRRGFHQWLRLFLLYTVVWSKHNFDNFHFWAKIKHHFKPNALIPIVGDSGSPLHGLVVYW